MCFIVYSISQEFVMYVFYCLFHKPEFVMYVFYCLFHKPGVCYVCVLLSIP